MKRTGTKNKYVIVIALFFLSIIILNMVDGKNIDKKNALVTKAAESQFAFKYISLDDIQDTRELLIVSSQYPLDLRDEDLKIVSAYKSLPLMTADITLNETALGNAKHLLETAKAENITGFVITSGYRTYEMQANIYKECIAASSNLAAKPNESEHQLGLALDISSTKSNIDQFENTRQGQWMRDNAHRAGFVMSYPKGKEDITGIAYEPWHFRYVGFPHAEIIHNKKQCLQEYVESLEIGVYHEITSSENKKYTVYRVRPDNNTIPVPEAKDYAVSRDGTGCYIVTVYQ